MRYFMEKTDSKSYSLLVGEPSPRVFHLALELTWIIISGFVLSKSLPDKAFAKAEVYQSDGSGAPANPE